MGSKKYWIKLWPAKWLSSLRVRKLKYEEQGLWFAIMVRAAVSNDNGELRVGDRPWTFDDICEDLGVDKRRAKKLKARLDRLVELELLEYTEDGAIRVCRFKELQAGRYEDKAFVENLVKGTAERTTRF